MEGWGGLGGGRAAWTQPLFAPKMEPAWAGRGCPTESLFKGKGGGLKYLSGQKGNPKVGWKVRGNSGRGFGQETSCRIGDLWGLA